MLCKGMLLNRFGDWVSVMKVSIISFLFSPNQETSLKFFKNCWKYSLGSMMNCSDDIIVYRQNFNVVTKSFEMIPVYIFSDWIIVYTALERKIQEVIC